MATIYVDAAMPDDTGNGLTTGAAKKTPRGAQNIAVAGDTILIKTGLCYAPVSGVFMFFSGVSNVTVGTYGTASDKPILDALTYQNPGISGWTYVSGGVWKKTFAAFRIRRVWVGSINGGILTSERIIGTAMRRATGTGLTTVTADPTEAQVLAGLDSHNIWFGGGTTTSFALYVYTGTSKIDPPTYYGGLAFIQSDASTVGSVAGVHVQNQTGIYVHDLHFRGNGGTGIRLQAQNSDSRDVENCLFQDCTVTAPYQGAFRSIIVGEATPARRIRSSTASRIYCDYTSSSEEMETSTAYNYLSGVVDIFNVADGSVGIVVEGCTAINSAHNGIVTGSIAMATTPPVGCKVINNTVRYDPWHTYARGMSCFDADTLFRGNLIDGQNTRSQFAGGAQVIGNVWINMRNCVRKAGVSQWAAFESYVFDTLQSGIGNDRYVKINPTNILFAHNTAYGVPGTVFSFNHFNTGLADTSNTYNAGTITVKNNIAYGLSGLAVDTYEDSGRTVGQQTITNNCIYNGVTGDNKVTWRGSNYTINAAPGHSLNVEVSPGLDSVHRPSAATVKDSGLDIDALDYYGRQFRTTPNMGAVDSAPPARTTVARTATTRTATTRKIVGRIAA